MMDRILELVFVLATISVIFTKNFQPRCGDILSSTQGSFSPPSFSPDQNKGYTSVRSCLWVIKGTSGKMIKLLIKDMYIETDPYCKKSRIQVEDEDRHIGNYCGSGDVAPIFTENLHLYVLTYSNVFKPFWFNATYSLVDVPKKQCGGLLNDTSGWFTSLDHDQNGWYDPNQICIWALEAKRDKIIILRFIYIDITGNDNCYNGDFIEVKTDYPSGVRYCGTNLPPLIYSESNRLKVRFVSDFEEEGEGFNITYFQVEASSIKCGGFLNDTKGEIAFSGDSVEVDASQSASLYRKYECLWIINAVADKIIELRIHQIHVEIEQTKKCQNASLLIHDGQTTYGTFCGVPSTVTSTSNVLFIRLNADENFRRTRFNASYTQIYDFSQDCGGLLTGDTGWIELPSEASGAPLDCLWVIQAEKDMVINLAVRYLNLEESSPCKDYLLVYDTKSPREKVCTSVVHKNPFRSISNSLYVRFHSGRYRGHGLSAEYTQVSDLDKSCGGILNASSGWLTFVDRDFDRLYDHNLDCLWIIKVGVKKHIYLEFSYIYLEASEKCRYDYLEVYETGQEKVRICSSFLAERENVISKSNELYVHFVTDASLSYGGFYATYEAIDELEAVCDRELSGTSGVIVPFNNERFKLSDENIDCVYLLKVEQGRVIQFYPFKLDTIWSASCTIDFLQIDAYKKFCGVWNLPKYISKTNVVRLHYRLLKVATTVAFNITYVEVWDHKKDFATELTATQGPIYFPNEESRGIPHCNLHYRWSINAGRENVVVFKLSEIILVGKIGLNENDIVVVREPHRNPVHTYVHATESVENRIIVSEYNVLEIILSTDGWGQILLDSELEDIDSDLETVLFNATYIVTRETQFCAAEYKCLLSNKTISHFRLCDNKEDCPNKDDERFCSNRCPSNCTCIGATVDCTGKLTCKYPIREPVEHYFHRIGGFKILDVSNNPQTYRRLQWGTESGLMHLEILNISGCEISRFSPGRFKQFFYLKYLDISHNALKLLPSKMFEGLDELETLRLEGNSELLFIESEAFTGLYSLNTLKLANLHIERISTNAFAQLTLNDFVIADSVIESVDQGALGNLHAYNVDIKSSKVQTFSDRMFERLSNVSKLVTSSYKFCCIKPYYLPKENCFPPKAVFSTCSDLLGNANIRNVLWIIGLFSVLTNMLSIKHHFSFNMAELRPCHPIFLLNIALSDLLMGVSVVIIVGTDTSLRGKYAVSEEEWRSSTLCLISGVVSSTSILVTSIFLCIIALGRLLVIRYPSGQICCTRKVSLLLALVAWSVALLISTIPALYTTYVKKEIYSKSGVCLGFHLRQDRPAGWLVLLVVVVFSNILSLLLIALGQYYIKKEIKETDAKTMRPRLNRAGDLQISRNILILVAVDVLCLMPVHGLGAFGWGDDVMDDETYAWMTYVIFAVMSAMNPVLFNLSDIFDIMNLTPSPEEQDRPKLCTEDEFAQVLSLLKDPKYWWIKTRKRGYISLTKWMTKKHISYEECALVAIGVAKRISGLHLREVTQIELGERDIFLKRRMGDRIIKIGLVFRAKLITRPTEAAVNMAEYGKILSRLVDEYDKRRYEDLISDKLPCERASKKERFANRTRPIANSLKKKLINSLKGKETDSMEEKRTKSTKGKHANSMSVKI